MENPPSSTVFTTLFIVRSRQENWLIRTYWTKIRMPKTSSERTISQTRASLVKYRKGLVSWTMKVSSLWSKKYRAIFRRSTARTWRHSMLWYSCLISWVKSFRVNHSRWSRRIWSF
jgi:hypothetical protein